MPRPSKTVNSVKGHRTKAELELRKAAEDNMKTNKPLTERRETKSDKIAHKEFVRVKSLLGMIEKDDDLYSAIINRYCLLQSECMQFDDKINILKERLNKLDEDYDSGKIEPDFYYSKYDGLHKSILGYDRQIMAKRKMLFDIEKENLMTVASGLRSIPKTPQQTEENPLLKALMSDDD